MASLSSVGVRRSLPSRLPVLLIGSGLANSSLARTLSLHGYSSQDQHFRIFDQNPKQHATQYAHNIQSWATDGLDQLIRRGRPKRGDHPGFLHFAAVDAHHGGKGVVRPSLLSLKSNNSVGDLQLVEDGTDVAYSQARVKSGVFLRTVRGNIDIEHDKKFVRFEPVVDENGREAVEAFFADGTSAVGSAIIAGDGLRSNVRSQLLPSIQPEVLPVVCYTGQWDFESMRAVMNKLEDGVVPAYNERPADEVDTHTIWVRDGTAFGVNYQYLDRTDARMQYIYARMAKGYSLDEATGKWVQDSSATINAEPTDSEAIVDAERNIAQTTTSIDPLFNPNRSLGDANKIPSQLFDEIKELKVHAHKELHLYIDSVNAQTNCKQYNWLMRTVKLPKEKAELDSLKSQLPGGDKVFLIGDAAHAAPIFQGQSGSHSLLDGFDLGTSLARAFRAQSQPSYTPSPSGPSSSPVLAALNAFEASRLGNWHESVEIAEGQLYDLFRPQAEWDAAEKTLLQRNDIDPDLRATFSAELDELYAKIKTWKEKETTEDARRIAYRQADWIENATERTEREAKEKAEREEALEQERWWKRKAELESKMIQSRKTGQWSLPETKVQSVEAPLAEDDNRPAA